MADSFFTTLDGGWFQPTDPCRGPWDPHACHADPAQVVFMNTDLTIVLHRPPVGEWLGMDSESHWQTNQIGMSDALLFDDLGPVGRAVQTLILRPVG